MALTENTYTGNGSTVLFSFTFPYLETTDIKVSLNGTLTTAYTLANATTVQFNTAPANGVAIRIYRATSDTSSKATFFPGSSIRAQDLNDNFTQILYKSQETENFAASTDASAIQATANAALANSNAAITTANAASTTANGIAATANTALANSNTAVSTATSASTVANAALSKAGGTMTGGITFAAVQPTATTSAPNIVQLTDSAASTSTTTAATPNSVKTAKDAADAAQATANAAMPKSGGTFTGDIIVPSINGGPLAGARNRVINGDMRIDARNNGASVTPANNSYTLDRWITYVGAASKLSIQQSTTAPSGFSNSALITSLSAYTVGASETFLFGQKIEGFNAADLAWGTASAKTITLSFWVRSSLTGTFGGTFGNASDNRWYPFSYTISAANTWEQKTITVAGDTSGTWGTGNGVGINVYFSVGTGSTVSGTAGSWSSSTYYSATGATSVVGTNGATFYITGVQLEAGTVATAFERRSYGQELALCQRYYENGIHAVVAATTGLGYTPAVASFFKVTKRATPTVTEGQVLEAVNIDTPSINQITASGCKLYYPTIYGSGYRTSLLTASIEL